VNGSVLVVDDEVDTAQLLRDGLRRRGLSVNSVHSAAACLDRLATDVVDVVVTDIYMTDMTGLELCAEIRQRYPDVLSIVITGPKNKQIRNPGEMAGKKIGLTRATLEEATVPKIAPTGTNIVMFDDIASTLQALVSGQVDAAGMSAFAAKSLADRNAKANLEKNYRHEVQFLESKRTA